MKRFLCFLTLLACFSLSVFAVPKVDGQFGPREYRDTLAILQVKQHESNCNLENAYLHWFTSPADQSVYLAVQYSCSDHTTDDSKTGVMVYINDVKIGTIHADGSIRGVDHGKYELEGFLDDGAWSATHDSFCELRVGIKFWPEGEINAGIQILDFGGNPSNYYEQLVYSPYTTTSSATETRPESTTTERSTTEKSTTEKSTTTKSMTETTTAVQKTTGKHTTAPVITASPTREATAASAHTATAAPASQAAVLQPDAVTQKTAALSKAEKAKTAKTKTTRSKTTKAKTTASSVPETAAASETAVHTSTEPVGTTAPAATERAAVTTQMYSELNKVKIVGTVLVAVILTAAIMSSAFLGMRQRRENPDKHTPQEEYDDFG